MTAISDGRVSPFGNLGISACVPLPRAYRSLPRPSSPSCAQASPTCFRSLDHKTCQAEHARSTTSDSFFSFTVCNRVLTPNHAPAKTSITSVDSFPTFITPFRCQKAWVCATTPTCSGSRRQPAKRKSMMRSRMRETNDYQKRFRIGAVFPQTLTYSLLR